MANPIFYTPYYYRRVYVKPSHPPPPIKHHYGYGGSHRAVFPAGNKPRNIGINAVKPPLATTPVSPTSVTTTVGPTSFTAQTSSALAAPSARSPMVASHYRGDGNRNNMPVTQTSAPYRGGNITSKNNENRPPVPVPQRNYNTGNNRPSAQPQHINNSSNRRENGNTPAVRAQQQGDNFTRGYAQQRGESSRTTSGTNNGNNRMGVNSGFGNRPGARR